MNIITIGGTKDFLDTTFAHKEIDRILKARKIAKKDLLVYGFEDSFDLKGAYNVAKSWAEKANVRFASGQIKNGNEDWKVRKETRDKALSENSCLLINLKIGTSNGGTGIINLFKENGVHVETVDPTENAVFVPDEKILKQSIKEFSAFVKKLLPLSVSLDCESTGLSESKDDIIELAIVDAKSGKTIMDSFVYTTVPIAAKAFEKNKITAEMLEGKPTLDVVWETHYPKFKGKYIIASNADFDEKMVSHGLFKLGKNPPAEIWLCLQKLYRKYSSQPKALVSSMNTEKMCLQMGIEQGTHRALADVQSQNKILLAMAKGVVPNFDV